MRLESIGAAAFVANLQKAQSALEGFQRAASQGGKGFDPRGFTASFDKIAADASRAGQSAGAGLATGFQSGFTGLDGIVAGFFLGLGNQASQALVGVFAAAGRSASQAFSDALDFQQAVANINSLVGGTDEAAADIADAIGSIAVDPKLIANTESAGLALQQLKKQGLDLGDIIGDDTTGGILRATVALQNAAGQAGNLVELREAAEVVGQGMALFGLQASDAGGLVDTFAAITTNTKFDLNDLNYILANSATAIQALGLSYNEIGAAAIATGKSFSSARTQGTALESLLLRLSAPTDKAREALQLLGVTAYDQQGNFIGLIGLQDQLQASFARGEYTAEAFNQLLVEAFGLTGSAMATALAQGQDLTAAMETLGSTSAAAISAIKTDTLLVSLQNLGDVAADLGRRLVQPFVDQLAPAVQAASSLLSSLAGTFDALGARIAASLGPAINFVTQQFNGLAAAIASLTGVSISVPTLAGGGAQAAPIVGAPFRGVTANSDASASGRMQGEQARQQQQISAEQLNAARSLSGGAKSIGAAMGVLDSILSSQVTALDKGLADEGKYMDKPDEKLRQLRAYIKNGSEEFAGVADDYRLALERIGIKPAEDAETFLLQVEELQASKAIFADPRNIALLIDEEAVKREVEMKELAKKGAENIHAAFGSYVSGLVDAAGGGVAAAPTFTPPSTDELPGPTAEKQQQLHSLYQKNIDEIQTAGIEQQGVVGDLIDQTTKMGESLGIVAGIFAGFNTILTNLADTIAGKDFAAAGLAVSGTLTSVIDALSQATELAGIDETTANLSAFTQTVIDSVAGFTDGLDGAAITGSASDLATTVVGELTKAVDSANLTGLAIAATDYAASVTGLLLEAIRGVKFGEIGLSLGTFVSRVANQLTGALSDPTVGANLTKSASNFAQGAIGALQGAFTTLDGALAAADENNDAGALTTAISGMVAKIAAGLTDAVNKIDLTGVTTEASGVVARIAGIFYDAIVGIDFTEIGTAAGEFVGTAGTKIADALSDPTVGENIATAVETFVGGLIATVQGAFELLAGALTGVDDTLDISALTGAIDNVVNGFVTGFVAAITNNFTNQETGALEITVPTIGVTPLAPVDLSSLISYTGNVAAPITVDRSTLVSYINELPVAPEVDRAMAIQYVNELPPAFQVERDKLVSYINALPPGEEVDRAKLVEYVNALPVAPEVDKSAFVTYINDLPGAVTVDRAALVDIVNELPAAVNLDKSALVSITGELPASVELDKAKLVEIVNSLPETVQVDKAALVSIAGELPPTVAVDKSTLVSITGELPAAIPVNLSEVLQITGSIPQLDGDITPLTGALNLLAPALTGASLAVGLIDAALRNMAQPGGALDLLTGLVTGAVDSITESVAEVDVAAIGGALNGTIQSVTGLFVTLSEIPDLGPITASVGGLVESLINLAAGVTLDLDGEAIGGDISEFAGNLVKRLGEAIAGVPLEEVGVAAASLFSALTEQLEIAFSAENTTVVGTAIGGFVTTLIGKIADTLGNPDFGTQMGEGLANLGGALVGGLTGIFTGANNALSELDAEAVGLSLNTFLTGFVDTLAARLDDVDVTALSTAVRDLIVTAVSKSAEGLSNIDADGIAGTAADSFYTTVESALVGAFAGTAFEGTVSGFVAERQAERDRLLAEAEAANAAVQAAGAEAADAGGGFFAQQQARFDADMSQQTAESEELVKGIFQPIADALMGGIKTAFAPDAIYTADIGSGISGAGLSLSGDISTSFAEDTIYPETVRQGLVNAASGIADAFGGILDAVTGFWDSLLTALPGWVQSLLGISGGGTAAEVEGPAAKQVADDVAATLASRDDVINLANTVANSNGQIAPILDVSPALREAMNPALGATNNTTTNVTNITNNTAAATIDQSAGVFDGTLPVVVTNAAEIKPEVTTNADGSLTEAGQEKALQTGGQFLSAVAALLTPATQEVATTLASVAQTATSAIAESATRAATIGPPAASGYNPLSSANTGVSVVEVAPVELSETAIATINTVANIQAQANAQGQDSAVSLTPADILQEQTYQLAPVFYQAASDGITVGLASSGLVSSGVSPDAAGLGGEFGPPLQQAIENNTTALTTLASVPGLSPTAPALGDVEPLELGADSQKLLEEQTDALKRNTIAQQNAASGAASDPSSALINPQTVQELTTLSVSLPNAGSAFDATLGNATTATGGIIEPMTDAANATINLTDATDDQITAADKLGGSFNSLQDKSDKAASNVGDLAEALTDNGVAAGLEDLTEAFDSAVGDINKALDKLDDKPDQQPTDSAAGGQTATQPGNGPFARGTRFYRGGYGIGGEEGAEMLVTPAGTVSLIGQEGPEVFTAPLGSSIYTATETRAIMAMAQGQQEAPRMDESVAVGDFATNDEDASRSPSYAATDGDGEFTSAVEAFLSSAYAKRQQRRAYATGTRNYPGGKGIAGEDGAEIYITPDGNSGIIGMAGPELFTAPAGTIIYPAPMTEDIISRGETNLLGGERFAAAKGAGVQSFGGGFTFTPNRPSPIGSPSLTIGKEDTSNRERESSQERGADLSLLGFFGQQEQQAAAVGFAPTETATSEGADSGKKEKPLTQQIAELFTRGLMGNRMDQAQTQVVNININNNQDNSQTTNNYNYGGLSVQSMRSTETVSRDFRLLQASSG